LRIRLRGSVERDCCRGAQQDQQFSHEFSLCRGETSRAEQRFRVGKLYCGIVPSPDAGRPEEIRTIYSSASSPYRVIASQADDGISKGAGD
jgi:hypothetical protein